MYANKTPVHTFVHPSPPPKKKKKLFTSRAPRGETKSSRTGAETKSMDMTAMAEAKARDSPMRLPAPKPQAAAAAAGAPSAVLTSVQEAVRRVRQGGDGADFLVVEWRQGGGGALGSQQQEQLEIKEVCFVRTGTDGEGGGVGSKHRSKSNS